MEYAVEIEDITVAYETRSVLWHISARIPSGKIVGILGPNGAGKSTLLKAIVGLVPLQSGKIHLPTSRTKIAYVPQRNAVDWDFPITAWEVVEMGAFSRSGFLGRLSPKEKEKIRKAMEDLGILSLADRHISELSGGQQQRVFLARALVQEADIYLMDEPFAGVDMATEIKVVEILRSLQALGKTLLLVHHDLYSAQEYFDWTVLLHTSLVAEGPVHNVLSLENVKKAYGEHLTTWLGESR